MCTKYTDSQSTSVSVPDQLLQLTVHSFKRCLKKSPLASLSANTDLFSSTDNNLEKSKENLQVTLN